MVEIGGGLILWHILNLYSHHGINDFIICCGYKRQRGFDHCCQLVRRAV